ncbi:hypothetical protein ACFYRN_42895 [Streptomyces sp. NPDC005227]
MTQLDLKQWDFAVQGADWDEAEDDEEGAEILTAAERPRRWA